MRRLKKKQPNLWVWYTKSFPVSWYYTPIEDEAWCNCSVLTLKTFKNISYPLVQSGWDGTQCNGIFLISNLPSHTILEYTKTTHYYFCTLSYQHLRSRWDGVQFKTCIFFLSRGLKYIVTCVSWLKRFVVSMMRIPSFYTISFHITVTSSYNIQIGYWETIYIVRKGEVFSSLNI